MIKEIKFFIKSLIYMSFKFFISLISVRSKNIIVMGLRTPRTHLNCKSKDYFMHNTKYLYLFLKNNTNLKLIYLCDDKKMIKIFNSYGYYNVYTRKSLKGIYYSLRAKYWLYDDAKFDVNNSFLSGGAVCINLWHGIPLKKIGFDMNNNYKNYSPIKKIIFNLLRDRDSFYNVNSEYEQSCYETSFLTNKDKIKIFGSPRLDVLFHDIPNADIFMEEECAKIKSFKEQGKKLLFYAPTFRDTGKDISGWLKSKNLHEFLKQNNTILVCKLHFADKNSLNFDLPEEIYKMDSNADIYPVLKYSDALITDYSSIYFDYLLLDKPIIYYPIDLEEYQKICRGFYRSYEELTAGVKAYNEQELINAIQDVINGVDDYKEERKKLRDKMFKSQDGKNCVRVVEWIKSLDKQL